MNDCASCRHMSLVKRLPVCHHRLSHYDKFSVPPEHPIAHTCYWMREAEDALCGPEGKLWECRDA